MLYLKVSQRLSDDDELEAAALYLKHQLATIALREGYPTSGEPEEEYDRGTLTVRLAIDEQAELTWDEAAP